LETAGFQLEHFTRSLLARADSAMKNLFLLARFGQVEVCQLVRVGGLREGLKPEGARRSLDAKHESPARRDTPGLCFSQAYSNCTAT